MASLLWSSTSVSSFAATNTITSGKFQSDTVKLPVESIPSRQLNLTPDTYLIAGQFRDMLSRVPGGYETFRAFDEIWKNPADRKTRLFDHCNTQKALSVKLCFRLLTVWADDTLESANRKDSDELNNIFDEARRM
ncbi:MULTISPECIES: hypothetical protein [unclassified Microcoleus]|uniref:hypothetical protein n=1 Tax=unclassified Microcoleus TaxID=2642155 RepID=UPI002FD23684